MADSNAEAQHLRTKNSAVIFGVPDPDPLSQNKNSKKILDFYCDIFLTFYL
jgi:hypothetical protein